MWSGAYNDIISCPADLQKYSASIIYLKNTVYIIICRIKESSPKEKSTPVEWITMLLILRKCILYLSIETCIVTLSYYNEKHTRMHRRRHWWLVLHVIPTLLYFFRYLKTNGSVLQVLLCSGSSVRCVSRDWEDQVYQHSPFIAQRAVPAPLTHPLLVLSGQHC
jgi:hypothetical protein